MYTNRDIFDDILELRNVVDNFFNRVPASARRSEFPPVNLSEKDDTVTITAMMPGVDSDSLNIQLVNTALVIEGEKKSDLKDTAYIRRERVFGKFQRSVKLPYHVDGSSVKANLTNGILTITLAKAEEAKPKRITIQ